MKKQPASKQLNILVIEDNPGDFILLKDLLELTGMSANIDLAESLEAATAYLRDQKPQVIFLDLFLPDGSGLDSFHQLKPVSGAAAIIILTGLNDTELALQAIALGAQDYLAKGEFDEKLLAKTISYSVERRRSLESLRQANERYSLASKATHDLIWDWNLGTNEVYRDDAGVKEVLGISTNEPIRYFENWYDRVHPEDVSRLQELIREIREKGDRDYFETEYRFRTDTGEYKNIYDRGFAIRNSEGRTIRMIGAAQDITEKRKLEIALQEYTIRQQKAVTEATIRGQENERKQLGVELHDNINQILATAKLYLDHALSFPGMKLDFVTKGKEFIGVATQEIRKLSHSLLPPSFEEFGLCTALNDLVEDISLAAKFTIRKDWNGFSEDILQKDQKLTIYRIVQEQLNNIIKHAEARRVWIGLDNNREKQTVRLIIKDNGRGFDPSQKPNGVGLRNIIGRAEVFDGKVKINSAPGKGCQLTVSFPYADIAVGS